MLIACQPLREAQRTVSVADSLRMNECRQYDDSLALAEAYSTLGRCRLVYPDDYARACYYYGRMLRQHNNQVAAMQAFINGSHAPYVQRVVPLPWFSDYHTLGRIYTNMGTMCHLIDEFALSYDMYECSIKAFQRNHDTTAYYYGLNAMALELAEQKMHDETLALLDSIEQACTDSGVLTKIWETKAILYFNIELFDSTIYSVKRLQKGGNLGATGYVKEAQAFENLQQYDSALYYAHKVVTLADATNQDKYNMLYIICNYDPSLDAKNVNDFASSRADIEKQNIVPLRQQLSVAVELLHQDLNPRRQYTNILVLTAVSIILIGILLFIRRRTSLHTTRELEKQHALQLEQHKLIAQNSSLRQQHHEMQAQYLSLQQKQELQQHELTSSIGYTLECLRKSEHWEIDLQWKDYPEMCRLCNEYFHLLITKLHALAPLSEKETRLCVLVLIGLNRPQIAHHIRYSQSGIGKLKDTTAKKIGTTGAEMRDFLVNLAAKA